MKIDQRVNLIRRYLLGELAEVDQAVLEQELLLDRGKFEQVWAVENELVDSYVRGEMSRADRKRFEGHYLASPLHCERVAIAESFLTDIDQAVGETVEVREKESVTHWRRRQVGKVRFGKDLAFATLPVNAGDLTKGDYILILFSHTPDGGSKEVDRYFFRVS